MRKFAFILVLVAAGLLGLRARSSAENNPSSGWPSQTGYVFASGYNADAQVTTGSPTTFPFIPATSSASTIDLSTGNLQNPAVCPRFKVSGRPNISISARFSQSGQSVAVRYVAMYQANSSAAPTILGISPITTITLEFNPPTDQQGRFIAPNVIQDSYGASDATLLIVSPPAAGTVTLGMGSY